MRIFYLLLITCLISGFSYADELRINGNKTTYTMQFKNLTEGPAAPDSPDTGDQYRNIETNRLYTWDGSGWVISKENAEVKQLIAEGKAAWVNITDPNTKTALLKMFQALKLMVTNSKD